MRLRHAAPRSPFPFGEIVSIALFLGAVRGGPVGRRRCVYRPPPRMTRRQWRQPFNRNGVLNRTSLGVVRLVLGRVATWALGVLPVWHWWRAQGWRTTRCVVVEGPVRGQSAARFPSRGRESMDLASAGRRDGQRHVSHACSPCRAGVPDGLMSPPREVRRERIVELTRTFALGTLAPCFVPGDHGGGGYIERSFWNGGHGIAAIGPMFALLGRRVVTARPRP